MMINEIEKLRESLVEGEIEMILQDPDRTADIVREWVREKYNGFDPAELQEIKEIYG